MHVSYHISTSHDLIHHEYHVLWYIYHEYHVRKIGHISCEYHAFSSISYHVSYKNTSWISCVIIYHEYHMRRWVTVSCEYHVFSSYHITYHITSFSTNTTPPPCLPLCLGSSKRAAIRGKQYETTAPSPPGSWFTLEFHVKGVGRLAAGLDTTDQATIVSTQLGEEEEEKTQDEKCKMVRARRGYTFRTENLLCLESDT